MPFCMQYTGGPLGWVTGGRLACGLRYKRPIIPASKETFIPQHNTRLIWSKTSRKPPRPAVNPTRLQWHLIGFRLSTSRSLRRASYALSAWALDTRVLCQRTSTNYECHMDNYIDLAIYEKNANVGGTWLENRYPGVACDVCLPISLGKRTIVLIEIGLCTHLYVPLRTQSRWDFFLCL